MWFPAFGVHGTVVFEKGMGQAIMVVRICVLS